MDARVLVVGDANVDLVLRGDVVPRFGQAEQLLEAADLTLGGSAAIVACGLAALDIPVRLAAAVGRDAYGDQVLCLLEERGVQTGSVLRRDGVPTGISVVLSAGERAILTYPGAVATLTEADLGPDPARGVQHVHVASPYLTPLLRPALPGVLQTARDAGCSSSLDTNDDPERAWPDLAALLAASTVVLPNHAEAIRWAEALGDPQPDWLAAATTVAGHGPRVVLKGGESGGHLVDGTGTVLTQAPAPIAPADTTGAGDSFDAGWIAARLYGEPPDRALRWAVAAGTLSTRAAGGIAGQPGLDELRDAAEALP